MPFTPDSELELLFPAHLIPQDVQAKLGDDLHVRDFVLKHCGELV